MICTNKFSTIERHKNVYSKIQTQKSIDVTQFRLVLLSFIFIKKVSKLAVVEIQKQCGKLKITLKEFT